jgi:adenine-specific DNA-methyltransferase
MEINLLNLRNSINKAYLKVKPNRTQIETFKNNINNLFDQIKESESEEFHKNIISEFLKNTYYSPNNYINTRGRYDLVIHNGKDSDSTVGVIFETKKPGNKAEMPTSENINTKAFQELILYYLQERITNKNIEIKYLVITDIFEWFIFNAIDFERLFAGDKNLIRQFTDFEEGRLSGTNTDFFYKNIAEQFVDESVSDIPVTCFDIRDFETIIKNADKEDDNKLIALYKIFSPEHLLKLPFANDSNNLDKSFYNELLHIIGLEETKEGSKKVIGRKTEKKRDAGSLIENAITIIKSEDCLSQVPKLSEYGNDKEEQLFNIALELVITWINRILFLKLLEGQLIRYNNGIKSFRFLNVERIPDYDELNKLFFQVLAVKENDRSESIKQKFSNIPYLNSSLFEPSELEHKTIRINSLDEHSELPVLSGTVLKDKTGRKLTGKIDPVQYLFEFLDSYDFSSEGSEEIQEENKTLINASVLGLIFEKINGYKDGSFFTPGFITMYMCHETIRRAVVQKFNEAKGWKCETITDVYNKIEDIKEANKIINSLRICDPAVGSGHFLVSALNEIIAIKSELKILTDNEGKKLKEYTIEVINDELIITDEQSRLFEYNPKSKESQRVQETLFQEKQKIIENCLFGVDINPNSVKICRLRLWIELLKNAYYKSETPQTANRTPHVVLETLPNIDINIKCGNSLISRYPLDADIKTALKSSKWNVDNYREAVMTYRNARSKDEKRAMEDLIAKIKNDFESEVSKSDKRFLRLNKLSGELLSLTTQSTLFDLSKKEKEEWNKKVNKLTEEIKRNETELAEIKNNRIYENAFEWRFEFPEVINNDGDFVGFDVVIGNPPYIYRNLDFSNEKKFFIEEYLSHEGNFDLYKFFIERILRILNSCGIASYIVSNTFLTAKTFSKLRKLLISNFEINELFDMGLNVFDGVTVENIVFRIQKSTKPINEAVSIKIDRRKNKNILEPEAIYNLSLKKIYDQERSFNIYLNSTIEQLINKLRKNSINLSQICYCTVGINTGYIKDKLVANYQVNSSYHKVLNGKDIGPYSIKWNGEWIKYDKDFIKDSGSLGRTLPPEYIFTDEKILVQRTRRGMSRKLVCAYDNEKFYNLNRISNIVIQNKEYTIKYIIALLNSRLLDYYFNKVFNEYEVKPLHLATLPIKILDQVKQSKFGSVVDQILLAKKSDPSADTSALETEIDRLVYDLYGLTEEEIQIVEGE